MEKLSKCATRLKVVDLQSLVTAPAPYFYVTDPNSHAKKKTWSILNSTRKYMWMYVGGRIQWAFDEDELCNESYLMIMKGVPSVQETESAYSRCTRAAHMESTFHQDG